MHIYASKTTARSPSSMHTVSARCTRCHVIHRTHPNPSSTCNPSIAHTHTIGLQASSTAPATDRRGHSALLSAAELDCGDLHSMAFDPAKVPLVHAMRARPQDAAILQNACVALANMANDAANKVPIVQAGARDVAQLARGNHSSRAAAEHSLSLLQKWSYKWPASHICFHSAHSSKTSFSWHARSQNNRKALREKLCCYSF